ncbi:ABC transporter substrate-binding protein [Cohnella herbarum]|uniref:Sugar ABC transporter substrate-binding protein n=1 Tax=Cohnella herbarum TaxID=2728023 RepID=A0A7Z2VRI4_9BACL|nr:sugar ABC transporter substrate-binding protein [Cohnella herbarum]QJD87722.1 sugar ABC transporter substrate-binding protein [Cohnella herbarum]
MKRLTLSIVVLLLCTVVLAACSSSNDKSEPSGTPSAGASATSAPSESAPAAKSAKLKIGLPGAYDVTSKEIIDGFIAKFPNIKVELQDAPWGDFTSKIATQIAGGTSPDVWLQENAVILGYGKRGVAEDLAPYIQRDLQDGNYIDTLFAAKTPEGNVWGVPHGTNPIALAYNKKVFDDAGIPYPTDDWTYDDLIETSKKLTKKDDKGNVQIYGFVGSISITQGWFPWIKQAGGQALDETKTKSMFSDPKTVAGLQSLVNGINDGYFTNGDFLTANGGDVQSFAEGKAAMYFLQYGNQVSINGNFPDTNWDVVKIPKGAEGKRYVPTVTNAWLISSKASQDSKDAAWEFLKYYLSDEAQAIVAKSGSTLPVNKTALQVLDGDTSKPLNKKAFTDGIAEAGVTLDENATWNEWRIVVQQVVNEIVDGNMTVEEGVKEIDAKVQPILDGKS